MGIFRCNKHGLQGFNEVCEHIANEFANENYIEGREFGLLRWILVCNECWETKQLNALDKYSSLDINDVIELPDRKGKKTEREFFKLYKRINRRVWCIECIAEVKVETAFRKGEAKPFPTFEKTLLQKHQGLIDELHRGLSKQFQFKKSIYWESQFQNRPAVFINAGAYTYPLTIQIYYVTDIQEQNLVMGFIDNFLKNIELNQAKVEFLEEENWKPTVSPAGYKGWRRGEEKILREVYLNC